MKLLDWELEGSQTMAKNNPKLTRDFPRSSYDWKDQAKPFSETMPFDQKEMLNIKDPTI
ncbi:hypothetical protein HUJ04_011724 [Dendroctonus ponderosae]|nr:hypothetical protein HUJ04_011724 [Dendroctonus ponderosae]